MVQIARLEGFYWVAKTGGYARAARQFPYPITQPGVHQQVRKLEGELGASLFARSGKDRMMLTDSGRLLFDFCAPFFEGLEPIVQAIEQGRVAGRLRIDAASLEISQVLPRWIKRLRRELPALQVMLSEVAEPDYARLRSGQTDLIVDYQPSPPADVVTSRVGTYYTFLVVPRELLPKRRGLQLKHMAHAPFASFPPGTRQYAMQLGALRSAGCSPTMVINASSVAGILGFVESGLCYSLVPWTDQRGPKLAGVMPLRVGGAQTEFPVSAARRRSDRNPLLEQVLACASG